MLDDKKKHHCLTQKSGQLSRYSDGLRAGQPCYDSRYGKIFLFSIASIPPLGPTHPPIQ
jgi:hypothetical protein